MNPNRPMPDPALPRRRFLQLMSTLGAGALLMRPTTGQSGESISLPFDNGTRELLTFPQKRPLIVQTSRPPQLETPFGVFNDGLITPNDAFFVRYHWSGIPTSVDPTRFRLKVGGKVSTPLTLSLDELKTLADPVELIAVNQCSGNSRGFASPRTNGGQLGNGAMGNARWTGVTLKTLLKKAGLAPGALQVSFNGLDTPPLGDGPDFMKALPLEHALDGEVMLAWAMNGADLPMLNGYPLRLVVPGYFGTYWVKHVSEITVLDHPFDGFWLSTAYRIPDNACECLPPGNTADGLRPIGRLKVRSFLTSLGHGAQIAAGQELGLRGIAFDGGYGIRQVAVSVDGGKTWQDTRLGQDLGRYSFREWTTRFTPRQAGLLDIMVRATSGSEEVQPMQSSWNPSGYQRNAVETTRVTVV